MKKDSTTFMLFIIFCCLFPIYAQGFTNTIYVKLNDTLALENIKKIDEKLIWERIFPYSPKFEERHRENGLHLWYKSEISTKLSEQDKIIETFLKTPGVNKAFFKMEQKEFEKDQVTLVNASMFRSETSLPVNDPLYPQQWHYQNRRFPNGIDINLEKAWEIEKGSRDVIVAIMDTPFDPHHEDYKDNVWVNKAELNGLPNVDDDGNGYIDDIYGYTFKPSIVEANLGDHGTHIAGVIAAVNNNGTGVCGIAGGNGSTNGVRIMRCHVMGGYSSDDDFANAFVYAADQGAVISQNSYTTNNSELISEGINYFMKTAGDFEGSPMKGGLVVWAAANDNVSTPCEPINESHINKENVIIVSSVAPDGNKTCYSNYGEWVDIAAPGGEFNGQGILSTITKNRYGFMQGTSMACPHISGIAALVVSKFKGNITPKEVKRRILSSVTDVNRHTEGQKSWHLMGHGIADTWKALLDNEHKAPEVISDLWISKSSSKYIELSWKIPIDVDDQAVDSCTIYYSTSPFTEIDESIDQVKISSEAYALGDTIRYRFLSVKPNKSYYFKIMGQDRWGNQSKVSEAVTCDTNLNIPIIYGDYLFNRFNLHLPFEGNKFNPDPLSLNYKILVPNNMLIDYKLIDPGKGINIQTFENNNLKLLIQSDGLEPGNYKANIIAFDKSNTSSADTLTITYQIGSGLVFPVPGPRVRPNTTLDFNVDQKKGSIDINLRDYIIDPNEMGLYFEYDTLNNRDCDMFSNGIHASLKDSLLHIDYQFSEELMEFDTPPFFINVPFSVMNYQSVTASFYVKIIFNEATSIEKIDQASIQIYPNPIENVVNIESKEIVNQVYIYSLNGYMVYQQKNPAKTLDLSRLSSGSYFIQLITPKEVIVKKIIKK